MLYKILQKKLFTLYHILSKSILLGTLCNMDPDFRGCQWTQDGTLAYWCEDPDDLISIPSSEQNQKKNQELWPQVNNDMLSPQKKDQQNSSNLEVFK